MAWRKMAGFGVRPTSVTLVDNGSETGIHLLRSFKRRNDLSGSNFPALRLVMILQLRLFRDENGIPIDCQELPKERVLSRSLASECAITRLGLVPCIRADSRAFQSVFAESQKLPY